MPDFQHTIERLCGRLKAILEQDSQAGVSSVLADDVVGQLDAPQRQALFRELLRIEIAHRRRLGLSIDPAEYERRFDAYRDVIREVFVVVPPHERLPPQETHRDDDAATVGFAGNDSEQCPVTLASRYTNLRFHARGGLGEVFRAHDESLRRDVAVKFIRPVRAAEPASREQFLLESEITGRLDHPGIVPVYGLGETFDNRVFLAMRFIDGRTFCEAINAYHADRISSPSERRRDFNRLLHHLVVACNVVAYAHSRGILHRDIKPENIMIGRFSETLVVDWGLAVPIERDERAKASGEQTIHVSSDSGSSRSQPAAGTIGYFSPESLDSNSIGSGTRSDIYSLGGTLYYLLTGRRSVSGGATTETLTAIRTGSFPSPRTLDRSVPRALDAICKKAMAVDPAARYASPLEMAADIEAFIEDEPVSVLDETLFERCRRTARHHRGIVLSVAAGLAAVAVVGILSGVWLKQQAVRERQARHVAEKAEQEGVRLAAHFAAQTVAGEIDVRWRILEALAADPTLRKLLSDLAAGSADDAKANQNEIQRWLLERIHEFRSVGADSWFILSGSGEQLARFPVERKTIHKSFATRDYFHGKGRELEEGADIPEPIEEPHLSRPYTSSSDGSLKIAYSVPVFPLERDAGSGRPIGVLAMTATAGEFRILHRGLSQGQVGVLVDMRGNGGADDPPGLVLHHPAMGGRIEAKQAFEAAFLPSEMVNRIGRLIGISRKGTDFETEIETNYVDRLWPDPETRWIAAFEPVVLANRPREQTNQRYPGLAVIVQLSTTSLPAVKPASADEGR